MEKKQKRFVVAYNNRCIITTIVVYLRMENKKDTTIVVKQWLKDHPRLNLAGICEDAGVDKGNFNRWFKGDKSLSEKSLLSIMQQLFNYGYKWFEIPAEEKIVAKLVDQPIKKETILISDKIEVEKPKLQIKRTPANWIELRRSLNDESEYQSWLIELKAADYLSDLERKQ